MPTKQLITISPTGEVSSLQMKKGKGLDLRVLGEASIKRSSLIEWDEQEQAWFIKLLDYRGCRPDKESLFHTVVSRDLVETAGDDALCVMGDLGEACWHGGSGECAVYFKEYEDAVTLEIATIQGLRKQFGKEAA